MNYQEQAELTEQVLADMLVEDTGRHMLDSGGAYGRHWERNQGITLEGFRERPEIRVDKNGFVTIDLFHFLKDRITYAPDVQEKFDELTNREGNESLSWYDLLFEFKEENEESDYYNSGWNSYNGENLLSQDIQGHYVKVDGVDILMLQIHGGCDARGGYTAPKAFIEQDGGLYDMANYTVVCNENTGRKGDPVCFDISPDGIYDVDKDDYVIVSVYLEYDKDNPDPALAWFDYDNMTWDEDKNTFIAPDGDGWLHFYGPVAG